MHRLSLLLLPALVVALSACDSDGDDAVGADRTATADVSAPDDTTTGVTGTVDLRQDGDELVMDLDISGLSPNSAHGFHIHRDGDCGVADFDDDGTAEAAGAAGPHYDPLGTDDHGAPTAPLGEKHAGDFGNVTADADGRVRTTIRTTAVSLEGERPVEGRAVMVHARRDDLETDPGGNSGARIGCGVISDAEAG